MKRDRTGLRSMTKDQHEDFYHRWRDMMLAVTRHGGVLVAGKDHQPYFKDLLGRLNEDPWWKLSNVGGNMAVMMFRKEVPFDELLIWKGKGDLITITELLGNIGLGRYDKLGMASDEQRPWAEDPK